jgi:hypothetical protein
LPATTLVCLDHGRFQPTEFETGGGDALIDAFRARLIDVYLASYREICDFAAANGLDGSAGIGVLQVLEECWNGGLLPRVTVVHGSATGRSSVAHFMIDGRARSILPDRADALPRTETGRANQFNAIFMREFVRCPLELNLAEACERSVRKALDPQEAMGARI